MNNYIYRKTISSKNKKYTYKYYDKRGNILKNVKKSLEGIYIPPGYNDVMINKNKNSKILAIGSDNKGRKQYIYNKKSINKNSKNKFKKLILFGKKYNNIINKINNDLNKNNKDKLIALILKIMIECNFRIGNEKYTKDNNSYGVSTLTKNHINIKNNKVIIDFIGKKGVRNICNVTNKKIINNLKTLKNKNNNRIFNYNNENITSEDVNNYLKQFGNFTTKNFRTWGANIELIKELLKKNSTIKDCIDNVAYKLHHTSSICKKNYLEPKLIEKFTDNPIKFREDFKGNIYNKFVKHLINNY